MRAFILGFALLALAPAQAEAKGDCQALLDRMIAQIKGPTLSARYSGSEGEWCVYRNLRLATGGHNPDFAADTLRLRANAPLWAVMMGEGASSDSLDAAVKIEGLRFFAKTGMANYDYLFQLQSMSNRTKVDLALNWDAGAKELRLTQLEVDFPGDNALSATARIGNVDLSSDGAAQMAVTGFAVQEATVDITSNGLFESVLLLPLGTMLLPQDGDMAAAAEALRAQALGGVADLPDASFSPDTKTALSQVIGEMPNPAGKLALNFQAPGGFGPARLTSFALFGVPRTIEQAAPLFKGTTLDATWTPQGQ